MADSPGELQKAADIIRRHRGNIRRIHYDKEIDACTVFFDVTAAESDKNSMTEALDKAGFLQTTLQEARCLKFNVYLPHETGALYGFLKHTTDACANIDFIDFDERGSHPDRVTVGMKLDKESLAEKLVDALKSKYRLEIVEYDKTGAALDNTVFYIRFATELRKLIGEQNDDLLLQMASDGDHIAQELANRKKNPKDVFDKILAAGKRLAETAGRGFYADVQRIQLTAKVTLFCFQPPCGGNIYALSSEEGEVLIDSGFGLYHEDVRRMLEYYGLLHPKKLSAIYLTHADADHAGGARHFPVKSLMHPGSKKIIDEESRAWGSKSKNSVLEDVYTRLINIFSEFAPPKDVGLFDKETGREGIFPVIGAFKLADMGFSVLESLGGHLHGQVFFLCKDPAVLFTGDSLINFESLSAERKEYNLLAVDLMTSVNVDSQKAAEERSGLLKLAAGSDYLICCGHGAVSALEDGRLRQWGGTEHYRP